MVLAFFMQFSFVRYVQIQLRFFLVIGLLIVGFTAKAQIDSTLTDTILSLSDIMRKEVDSIKLDAAESLEKLLTEHYSNPQNFGIELEKIPYLGQLKSPDGKVQMLCWNVAFEDETFQYYAFMVHQPQKGQVAVTVFEDSEDWERINRKTMRPNKWYGALYYKILSNKYKGKTYYTLLGWDGKDNITNRKVVDVMTIQGKTIMLGSSIFKTKDDLPAHRLTFEYANDVSMALNWDEKEKMIIMDHLAPEDSKLKGMYQFYGPDFSYDALQFKKGEWVLLRDVFAKNRSLNNLPEDAKPGDFKD